MARLLIPAPYRPYTNGESQLETQAATAGKSIHELVARYPALKRHLFSPSDRLRPFVHLFLTNTHIKDLEGLDTPLQENDTLRIVPRIAGG